MLAIVSKFAPAETDLAFRLLVNWTVRFLIVGGGRTGTIEEFYSQRAQEVSAGTIATAKQLAEKAMDVIPSDKRFQEEFAKARVSQNYLARYYLRALEMRRKQLPNPEFVPNEEPEIINLEHILPQNPAGKWGSISPETASAIYRRVGNLVLLSAKLNSMIGNEDYATKKPYLQASGYLLRQEAAKYVDWGENEINERQEGLARLAVETWPLKVR